MNTFFDAKGAERMGKLLLLLAGFVTLFMCMKFIGAAQELGKNQGDLSNVSTIDVSGTGTAFAIPDVANESFTIEQKAATVHDAQTTVSQKANDVIAFLKDSGVAEKDIQTTNYSANPEYSYPQPCTVQFCPVSTGEPKLTGYTVSETVTVKIRDTSATGKIIDGLGSRGVTGLSGPNFTVDDPDAVNAEARKDAINDAQEKAKILARDLGVRLVRVVRFNENGGGGYPMPMYAKDMAVSSSAGAQAPVLPAGQNKYVSNVTITYEIR